MDTFAHLVSGVKVFDIEQDFANHVGNGRHLSLFHAPGRHGWSA